MRVLGSGSRVQETLNFVASFVGNFVAFVESCFSLPDTEARRNENALGGAQAAVSRTSPPAGVPPSGGSQTGASAPPSTSQNTRHPGLKALAGFRLKPVLRPGATRAFTLIEILVVVMLLTVLMLTAFPAFRGLERSTNRHRAVAEADALAQAALAYRRTYGQWPMEPAEGAATSSKRFAYIAGDPDEVEETDISLDDVIRTLRGGETPQNPRGTRFLEVAENQLNAEGMLVDPWNQPYVLIMGRTRRDNTYEVRHHEGGVLEAVGRKQPQATADINAPEDVVAFSWGDPAISAEKRVIGSWSKR